MRARLQFLERLLRASCSFVICSIMGKILVLWKRLNCWEGET